MDAHMSGNQSGAEKDNRPLFREQWMLLFSKSKMALFIFSQSGAELRIQDGGAHESRPCWKTAHQASTEDWDRSHGFPWPHKSRQMSRKNCHATSKSILTVSCGPNDRGLSGKWLDWETWVQGLPTGRLFQSIMGRWPHWEPIRMN